MTIPAGRFDRVVGCLIGGAIGDSWGSGYERIPLPFTVDLTGTWVLTDDTQLTLATCEAIVADGRVNAERIAAEMARAFRAGTLVGLGASTYQALESLAAGGHWALVGRKGDQAAGNGAAMRVAPLAFCLDLTMYGARQQFRDICRITHHNDEAYAGALAIAFAIQAAYREVWVGGAGLIAHVARLLPDSAVRDRMLEFESRDPGTPLQQFAAQYGNSGYVVESVPLSLFAAQQADQTDFTSWLRGVIAVGGDTDTIASMAGQVVGCCLGGGNIPDNLIARIPEIELVRLTIKEFAAHVAALETTT
jgi:ADP-ribosylglycohydrolase